MENKEQQSSCEIRTKEDEKAIKQSELISDEEKEKLAEIRKKMLAVRRRRGCCG